MATSVRTATTWASLPLATILSEEAAEDSGSEARVVDGAVIHRAASMGPQPTSSQDRSTLLGSSAIPPRRWARSRHPALLGSSAIGPQPRRRGWSSGSITL